MEKWTQKKRAFWLHLPQNHYNIEMANLPYFGVFVDFGGKAVTDCDSLWVIGGWVMYQNAVWSLYIYKCDTGRRGFPPRRRPIIACITKNIGYYIRYTLLVRFLE